MDTAGGDPWHVSSMLDWGGDVRGDPQITFRIRQGAKDAAGPRVLWLKEATAERTPSTTKAPRAARVRSSSHGPMRAWTMEGSQMASVRSSSHRPLRGMRKPNPWRYRLGYTASLEASRARTEHVCRHELCRWKSPKRKHRQQKS